MKISLIGFTGAGKSAVAKELAKNLEVSLVEMDQLIIKKSGKENIAHIFELGGEVLFRELEIGVAKELQDTDDVVISTGGGVIMNKIIIDYLKSRDGVVINLRTSLEQILKRQPDLEKRPLFKEVQKAEELYRLRKPLYEAYADISIETDGKNVLEITEELLLKLKKEKK